MYFLYPKLVYLIYYNNNFISLIEVDKYRIMKKTEYYNLYNSIEYGACAYVCQSNIHIVQ